MTEKTTKAAAQSEPRELTGEQIELESSTKVVEILIESLTPILPHQFGEKARREMARKHAKVEKQGKEVRDPVQDAVDALYFIGEKPEVPKSMRNLMLEDHTDLVALPFLQGAAFGMPPAAFKHAVCRAGKTSDFKMVDLATTLYVEAHGTWNGRELVALEYDGIPMMRCDPVTVGNTSDLRYRCELHPWKTRLKVRFNSGFLSIRQIGKLFIDAGDLIGIADWRPEKFGTHGRFRVVRIAEMKRTA